nr:response regulator [Lachnospiraceae bacterium]
MHDKEMKTGEIILIVALVLILGVASIGIGVSSFDRKEAREAIGESYDLSEGWTYVDPSVGEVEMDLPERFETPEEKFACVHDAGRDYEGLALTLYATNAAFNVYVNGNMIYETGNYTRTNDLGEDVAVSDGTDVNVSAGIYREEMASREDMAMDITEETEFSQDAKADAGKIIIDLPSHIPDGSTITVVMYRISASDPVTLQTASVSKRDVAIINIIKQSMFPLLCAIIIIICAVILEALDVIRWIQKKRRRGLIIVALFALDAIIYSFIRTEIFYVFFGNRMFFLMVEEISFILMPVFVTGFFLRGFKIHFPKLMRGLFYSAAGVAVLELITYPFWGELHTFVYQLNMFWKLIILAILMVMLVKWKNLRPQSRKIMMDESALICLAISILAAPSRDMVMDMEFLDNVKMIATTAYFIFMAAQHVQIMLAESRYQAERRAKELEEQNEALRIAHEEAEEAKNDAILANEAKSRFLANMSHEIRTPINAVLGMDEMILRESRDTSIREYAVDIRSAGRTLLSLINDILDFSKIESGKMEIVPVEYEVATMVIDLSNMIRPRVEAKDLEFILEVDENIPKKLFGDDVRVRQCITNILTNAVKYTPEGKVWLRLRGEKDEDGYLLHCEVEDTGIGIKEEDIPKLFKEYERIEESRNRNIEGTGLGMNITMSMLSLMKSKLEVKSVYGKGSTFWFDVHQGLVDETPVGSIEVAHQEEANAALYTDAFIAPDAHMLLVDDNAMNRKVFMQLLKATRIQIDEADCGPAAIELAKKNHYHFIFMDHMMPDMDGIEAMQAIRALGEGSPNEHTPIYVLTANAVAGAREMYLEAGFDGFLAKPVMSDKLEEALRENLPDELMMPAPEGEGMVKEAEKSGPPDDLPSVDGLDWHFAWIHLPGMDMLEESVKQFYELIDVHGDKLQKFYEALPEEMDNYRIQVHGMKSSAATIGIVPLAGMAKILEFAAKDSNEDIIQSTHDVFMNEWKSYKEKLSGVFGIVPESDADRSDFPMAEKEKTFAMLEMLKNDMEDFDVDTGDELVAKLKEYRYPDDISDIMKKIYGAVA